MIAFQLHKIDSYFDLPFDRVHPLLEIVLCGRLEVVRMGLGVVRMVGCEARHFDDKAERAVLTVVINLAFSLTDILDVAQVHCV